MAYKNPAEAVLELAKYFTSGNNVPVDSATIKAKDFWEITGLNPERFVKDPTGKAATILSRVAKVLGEYLDCRPSKFMGQDFSLLGEFDIDSLDIVEITMGIEDEFGIEIPDSEVGKIRTVKSICDLVELSLHRAKVNAEFQ